MWSGWTSSTVHRGYKSRFFNSRDKLYEALFGCEAPQMFCGFKRKHLTVRQHEGGLSFIFGWTYPLIFPNSDKELRISSVCFISTAAVSPVTNMCPATHMISVWALLKSWMNWQMSPKSSSESWSAASPNLTLTRGGKKQKKNTGWAACESETSASQQLHSWDLEHISQLTAAFSFIRELLPRSFTSFLTTDFWYNHLIYFLSMRFIPSVYLDRLPN